MTKTPQIPIFVIYLQSDWKIKREQIVPFFCTIDGNMIEQRITDALATRFQEEDLTTCFLVDVKHHNNNKVEVYVDADHQLTIEMCRKISRHLEHLIEEHSWLPEKYTLDVSSPGIDNPLKLHRQYVKNIGRKAAVTLKDQSKKEGKITAVTPDLLTIDIDKKGETELSFDDIHETKILVSFK